MTPLEAYQQALNHGTIIADHKQLAVMQLLDTIYFQLIRRQKKRNSSYGKLRRTIKPRPPIKGLYVWGQVGIGKTFLIDLFYHNLPVNKLRIHFHQFMSDLHQQLTQHQGQADPLKIIARHMAHTYLVICFDEFFVSNIADAMLLSELFKHLFAGGVCLITTSNIAPDDLYLDGIQRERFMPAIDLIKKYTHIIHLDSHHDYRQPISYRNEVFFSPLDDESHKNLMNLFIELSHNSQHETSPLHLLGRDIHVIQRSDHIIWCDFNEMCTPPRSHQDYLAIARQYNTVIISNIPQLDQCTANVIILFIQLIDILYDQHIQLIISSAVPIDQLNPSKMKFEFARTQSRLLEMNSLLYIHDCHAS